MEKLQPRWPPSWQPQGGSSVWTWFLQNQPKVARRRREMQPNSSSSSSLAFSIFTPWITLFSYVLGLHRSAPWGQNSGSRCISRVFLSTLLCLICIFLLDSLLCGLRRNHCCPCFFIGHLRSPGCLQVPCTLVWPPPYKRREAPAFKQCLWEVSPTHGHQGPGDNLTGPGLAWPDCLHSFLYAIPCLFLKK